MDVHGLKQRLFEAGSFVEKLSGSESDPSGALIAFASQFGEPAFIRGRMRRPIITEVRPREHFDPASFAGTDEFRLHTDLAWLPDDQIPRLMFLLCVRPEAAGGGASLEADGWSILKSMSPAQRLELQETKVTMRSHRDVRSITYREDPLLKIREGRPAIRFRRDLIEGSMPDAVRVFGEAADRSAKRFFLQAGEVLVMDNTRMLHGREQLNAGLASDRLLLRLHVR